MVHQAHSDYPERRGCPGFLGAHPEVLRDVRRTVSYRIALHETVCVQAGLCAGRCDLTPSERTYGRRNDRRTFRPP